MKCPECEGESINSTGSNTHWGCADCFHLWPKDQPPGGAKFDHGKIRPSLILHGFPRAIEAVAEVGMYGLTLHEEGSWKDVPNGLQRYREALQRHLLKHATEDRDKGSGLLHEAHQCWNNLAVLELRLIEMEKATETKGFQTP